MNQFNSQDYCSKIYQIGSKIPKRDKLGIYSRIENLCVEIFTLAIEAALTRKIEKIPIIKTLHIKVEVLKHLVRICAELRVVEEKTYINLQIDLQEISKMATKWLKYQTEKESV